MHGVTSETVLIIDISSITLWPLASINVIITEWVPIDVIKTNDSRRPKIHM